MGCCASTERSSSSTSPYGSNHASPDDSSRTRIARPPEASHGNHTSVSSIASPDAQAAARSHSVISAQQVARPPAAEQSSHHPRQHHGHHSTATSPQSSTAAQHPNRPLNPPPPKAKIAPPPSHAHYDAISNKVPPLTRAALLKERRDFFDTRVTGRQETWAAVKLVCELLEQNNLTDAQAVLDAAGCTCPSGDLWGRKGGIYDEFGEKYVVPPWVVAEPPDVVQEGPEEEEKSSSNEEEDDEEISREKGKGKAVVVEDSEAEQPLLRVRARLSHTAQDVIVRFREEDKIRVILRKVRELANLPLRTQIRIGYLGKMLHEHETLSAQGWKEGYVINVYVFEPYDESLHER